MKANDKIYSKIENAVLRIATGHRGGGVEIALDAFGFKGAKMTAYQNYLGGGMISSIANDCTISDWANNAKLSKIADNLRLYYFNQQNDNGSLDDFDSLQNRSISAY